MKIRNINTNNKSTNNQTFKSIQMTALSKGLYALGNNDMLNAAGIDLFAMDTPRTIIETKHRGKNAGIEMGFREYTGTFIAEFSATLFAVITSKIMSKVYKPDIEVNAGSWATNKALDTFNEIYQNSDKTVTGYVKDTLSNMTGIAGDKIKSFASIDETKTKPIVDSLTKIITDTTLSKKQIKTALNGVQDNIIETLGADNNIIINAKNNSVSSNLTHALRDITDLAKNVFFKDSTQNSGKIISKLKTINNSRILLAIPASMLLAITNQYINRQLTKKRTGIDNFVGENGYENNVKTQNQTKKEKGLMAKKAASAGVFLFMLSKVMGIKQPSDLITKLEFTGPATSGNTIKTVYGTLILGRIFASKDSTELRETTIRDYLGFLNWLVFGGFVAKGTANILDPAKENLFNITKQGRGISHWLKDVSLKSQKEIIAQGGNVTKNLRNLNISQIAGIAYSALMLGIFLPRFNIAMTKQHGKKSPPEKNLSNQNMHSLLKEYTFERFEKEIRH